MQHNYIQTPYVLEAVLPIVVFGHYTNVWSLNYIVSKQTITNIHTKKTIPPGLSVINKSSTIRWERYLTTNIKKSIYTSRYQKKKATANYNVRKYSEYKQ